MNRTSAALLCAALAAFLGTATAAFGAPTSPTPAPTVVPMASPTPVNAAQPTAVPTTLNLSQAEQIALASSPQLTFARAVVDQSQAGIGVARSGELPSIDASG